MDELMVGHLMSVEENICYKLDVSPFTIGRDRGCNIECPNLTVSPLHCMLRYQPSEGWVLINCSFEGILVDNKVIPAESRILLTEGNYICIGDGNDKVMWVFSSICLCTQAEPSFEALEVTDLQDRAERMENFLQSQRERLQELAEEDDMILSNLAQEAEGVFDGLICMSCLRLVISAGTHNCACAHTFCNLCLFQWKRKICPICRSIIVSENRPVSDKYNHFIRKTVNLIDELKRNRAQVLKEVRRLEEEVVVLAKDLPEPFMTDSC